MSWNPVVAAVVLKCLKLQQCICMDPSCRLSASCDDCCGGDHAWGSLSISRHLNVAMSIHLDHLVQPKKKSNIWQGACWHIKKYILQNHLFSISVCIFPLSSCKNAHQNIIIPTKRTFQRSSKKKPSGSERFGPLPSRSRDSKQHPTDCIS